MSKRGKKSEKDLQGLSVLYEPPGETGMSSFNPPRTQHNLAIQRSIMEIFDEFTFIISGELKSLDLGSFKE